MGMMIFLPLILLIVAVGFLSPLIGIACGLAASICAVVLVYPARRLARDVRTAPRVIGILLMAVFLIAALAFALVAGIAFGVAIQVYGSFV